MDTRRKLLKKIGLGTAAAGLVIGARRLPRDAGEVDLAAAAPGDQAGTARVDPAVAGDGPWWLLEPLQRGAHLGQGWFLAHLGGVQRGASVLTLQHQDGRVARVHVCNHAGSPRGLAHTALLDLVLMDGGQGDQRTPEDLGRVLLGLAQVIRGNELRGDADLRQLATLESHAERVDAYGPESLT